MQRTPITGILTALTSSSSGHSSTKYSNDRQKNSPRSTTFPFPPPSDEYDSSNERDSEDDALDDSLAGSLDSLLLSPLDVLVPMDLQSSSIRVAIAMNDFVTVTLTPRMNSRQLLEIVCQRKQLNSGSYYLVTGDEETEVKGHELVSDIDRKFVRIKKKRQYEIEVESQSSDFGITFKQPKALCRPLEIKSVAPCGVAEKCGILADEEVLVLNGELTLNMEENDVERALETERLRLLVQTTRYDPESQAKMWWVSADDSINSNSRGKAKIHHLMAVMDEYLKEIVVPPPPVTSKLQPCFIRSPFSLVPKSPSLQKKGSIEDILNALTIPHPDGERSKSVNKEPNGGDGEDCDDMIQELLKKAEAVTKMCRLLRSISGPSLVNEKNEADDMPVHQLNDIDKIWKVLEELVETETNYVVDLDALLHRFLEPLHAEGFLANPAMESLLMSVRNIVNFQQAFLEELSQSFSESMNRNDIATLNRCLLSVSTTLLQRAAQFKLYAVFCSCHTVAQDLIEQTKSPSSEVRAFLDARNPKQQHSLSLDSYLIKPIQRVLKYPLLLQELLSLTESLDIVDIKTKRRLKSTLHAMHAVARHINDSQTVHDEFGMQGFHEIMEQAALMALGCVEIASSLTLTNLFCYSSTEWLNAPDDITMRKKKGNFLEMLILVFRSSVVLLCRSTKQRKKSGIPASDSFPTYNRAVTTDFIFTDVIPRENITIHGKCEGLPTAIELTSTDIDIEARTYRLLCTNNESKQRVLKSVRYIIKEASKSSVIDDIESTAELQSINTPRSTPTLQHRFFYLPTNQSDLDDSGVAPPSKIPMTLPLPCYDTMSETSSTEPVVRTRKPRHTKPPSNNRRSGLYITMKPQRLTKNSVLLSHNDIHNYNSGENPTSNHDKNPGDFSNILVRCQNNQSPSDLNNFHGDDESSISSSSDIMQNNNRLLSQSTPNLTQHRSPYHASYELSTFEGNF